ncbi:MAG: hypothetical protein K0S48_2264 [Ramlibacter sp.]|jgi:cobalamin biosynthesis protein CobD/CbiB|nr:hypothetical protein [Ramlibacter sp.]MCE3270499.1 hypothetical protein [Ramlibacter sp.]
MHWLRSLVDRYPKHARIAGKALFLAGGILILGAIFARAGLAWPLPEGPVVFGIAVALVLGGVVLTHLADQAPRG